MSYTPTAKSKAPLEVISLVLRQKLQQRAAVGKSLLGRSDTAGAAWVVSVVPGLVHGPRGSSHSVLRLSLSGDTASAAVRRGWDGGEELHHERL